MRCIIFLMTLLTITSCGSKKEITEAITDVEPIEVSQDPLIVFSKGACYGTCPVYTLNIDESGNMTFEGKRNVEKLGKYTKKLDLNSLQELLEYGFSLFEKLQLLDMERLRSQPFLFNVL